MRLMMMSHSDIAGFLFNGVTDPFLKVVMGGILVHCQESTVDALQLIVETF